MNEEKNKNQLLLVIVDSFPISSDIRYFSKLPYLGMVGKNGLWTSVIGIDTTTRDEIIKSTIASIMDEKLGLNNYWVTLDQYEIQNLMASLSSNQSRSEQMTQLGLEKLFSGGHWDFIGINIKHSSDEYQPEIKPQNLDDLYRIDKQVETLALAAGERTAIMVVFLPYTELDDGWLVAGGANVASVGNPGTVTLVDVFLTIFWWLDIDSPIKMDGRIIEEIMEVDSELSQDEMDLLTDHLRGLGYLG